MNDADGPQVARVVYEQLILSETFDANSIPYALDKAVTGLRDSGLSPARWAPFIHIGA
jgi:hypothetical protein